MWSVDDFVVIIDQLQAEDLPVVHLLRDKVFVASMWIRMPDDVRVEQPSLLLAAMFQRHKLYVGDVPVPTCHQACSIADDVGGVRVGETGAGRGSAQKSMSRRTRRGGGVGPARQYRSWPAGSTGADVDYDVGPFRRFGEYWPARMVMRLTAMQRLGRGTSGIDVLASMSLESRRP
jgi:hypothetical protein